MLIVVSHAHLYFVKRTMSESMAIRVVASPKIFCGEKYLLFGEEHYFV